MKCLISLNFEQNLLLQIKSIKLYQKNVYERVNTVDLKLMLLQTNGEADVWELTYEFIRYQIYAIRESYEVFQLTN